MICPQCGENLPEGAPFCDNCGAKLDAAPPQQQPYTAPPQYTAPTQPQYIPPQPYEMPQKQKSPLLPIILGVAAVLILGIGGFAAYNAGLFDGGLKGKEEAVEEEAKADKKKDKDKDKDSDKKKDKDKAKDKEKDKDKDDDEDRDDDEDVEDKDDGKDGDEDSDEDGKDDKADKDDGKDKDEDSSDDKDSSDDESDKDDSVKDDADPYEAFSWYTENREYNQLEECYFYTYPSKANKLTNPDDFSGEWKILIDQDPKSEISPGDAVIGNASLTFNHGLVTLSISDTGSFDGIYFGDREWDPQYVIWADGESMSEGELNFGLSTFFTLDDGRQYGIGTYEYVGASGYVFGSYALVRSH